MNRFRLILLVFLLPGLIVSGFIAHAEDDNELPPVKLINTRDLRTDSVIAEQQQLPILLYFASENCRYCRFVEEEQLKPMLRNRAYDKKIIVRRIYAADYASIYDFNGKITTGSHLASRYQAPLTPTLVFVDHQGKEIAPRIVGVVSPDYYSAELDDSINLSLITVKQQLALNRKP